MVWATLTLVITVPVTSRIFSIPDAVFLILSGLGSFFRALLFLSADDIDTLNAVFIVGNLTEIRQAPAVQNLASGLSHFKIIF